MTEELKVVISAEMAKFASAMKEALTALNNIQKELKQTNSESEKANKKTQKMGEAFKKAFKEARQSADENFKKIGTSISNGLKSATTAIKDFTVKSASALKDFAIGGITALSGAIMALNAGTEDYRVKQAQLQSAFEQAGMSASNATSVYNDLYKVMGDSDTAVEASQQIALLTNNIQEASAWADIASGVMGTFGDALKPETFYESANETLRLNEATGAFTQMLEGAGVNVEEFNKELQALGTEEEKRNFLLETSNEIMGEAGARYDEQTKRIQEQREAQAGLQETLAELGNAVAPVVTAFISLADEALEKVAPYLKSIAEEYAPLIEPFFTNLAETVLPALKTALSEMAGYIESAISWIVDNWGIIAGIAGVIAIITTAIGLYNIVAGIKQAMDVAQVTTLSALIGVYLAQASAMIVAIAPYVAIVGAIVALIAIIVLCIKYWDEIKEAVAKAWEWIKQKTSDAVNAVVNWFNQMKEKVSNKIQEMKQRAVTKFEEIKQGISEKVQSAKDRVSEVFNNIRTSITDKITQAKTSALQIFDNIKSGITEKINGAKDAVKTAIDTLKGFFNFSWELPHIKLPHFSISGSFSLNPPRIPTFSVSWYQQGGVFDKPTLFGYGNGMLGGLGENGAEAVVPLEKNTQWLDRIAERLNGNGRDIILEVDGTVFGRVSANSINQLTKQTGKLPIKVM